MTKAVTHGHTVSSICDYVGISRQAYYKRLQTSEVKNDLYNILEKVVISNRKIKSRVGLRTIYHKEQMSTLLGVNKFETEMSFRGFSLRPYRSFIKTTDSRGRYYRFDNLISGLDISDENLVIVGDIAYYQSHSINYYIFHFADMYTHEIKGIIGGKTMEGVNAEKCLRQVFRYNKMSKYNYEMILHTDAGSQYRSHKFQRILRNSQLQPSHARSCFENGLSERINGIIKNEYLIDYDIKSVNQLNTALKKIQKDINTLWPSRVLGNRTPVEFSNYIRELQPSDRPTKTIKIVQQKQKVFKGINN